ncbi:hypothetical protein BVC80_9087g81 [Macleaya cordata]|uniref:C2H2-type domain-containing protein n=1 Tax=Macleaya cordata TaxID=56857 RepID=A0A200PQV2_MACCD|nr:hypothetical protein BVC80_9087g81 [Macleaya cordata]
MAGRKELGFPKTSACSLRELAAKTTLRNVKLQGHTYVDLRENGKKFIFYCTLCRAPCYNDSSLFDHLKGNLHAERYAAAKVTLMGPNPFPFNDGVFFFHDSSEQDKPVAISGSNQDRFLNTDDNSGKLAVVSHTGKPLNTMDDGGNKNLGSGDHSLNADDSNNYIVIPRVVCDGEISDLEVKFVGFGEIAARICEDDKSPNGSISSIWCAWLGKENSQDGNVIPDYDFGIVTFSYNCSLGRSGISDDSRPMLTGGPYSETENVEGAKKKRKKSFSDPEDISESLSKKRVSFGEDHLNTTKHTSTLALDQCGEQTRDEKIILSKTVRRDMRRQQQLEADRMCDICQQKILAGKDVSTLLNMKTGQLACSSRNKNGAFHVFHTSCLIHWILFCEFQMWSNQLDSPKMTLVRPKIKNGSERKGRAKRSEKHMDDLIIATMKPISSVFCPECQGTGIHIEEKLEEPTVFLSEMFKYKIKVSEGHRAWMKGPEILENCSTGLRFSSQSDKAVEDIVKRLKLLHFYRADV